MQNDLIFVQSRRIDVILSGYLGGFDFHEGGHPCWRIPCIRMRGVRIRTTSIAVSRRWVCREQGMQSREKKWKVIPRKCRRGRRGFMRRFGWWHRLLIVVIYPYSQNVMD
jgi:hypothetical protein